jgi:hypothetical protein
LDAVVGVVGDVEAVIGINRDVARLVEVGVVEAGYPCLADRGDIDA